MPEFGPLDAKDQIIFQQLDVIRQMTENNLRRVGDDFWGAPKPAVNKVDAPQAPDQIAPAPVAEVKDQSAAQPADQKAEEKAPTIDELKEELNTYIGLDTIKKEVNSLINMMTVYKMRKEHDLPTLDMSLHMVFTGNPGTGKTMIARLMAKVYKCLEILSKGQLVEVDRSGLVAGYVGQTAIKTQEVITKALGGVLFIDEAYALNGGGENDFGQEAIDTLLKAMEDHRGDLVVIVAGYDDLMRRFIGSNPGLESRFNRYLHFDDYTLDEMTAIFEMQCKKGCYTMDDATKQAVRDCIAVESLSGGISFGNARGVRNVFEHVLSAQNNRLAAMEKVSREDLMQILPVDIWVARGLDPKDMPDPDTVEKEDKAPEHNKKKHKPHVKADDETNAD